MCLFTKTPNRQGFHDIRKYSQTTPDNICECVVLTGCSRIIIRTYKLSRADRSI